MKTSYNSVYDGVGNIQDDPTKQGITLSDVNRIYDEELDMNRTPPKPRPGIGERSGGYRGMENMSDFHASILPSFNNSKWIGHDDYLIPSLIIALLCILFALPISICNFSMVSDSSSAIRD